MQQDQNDPLIEDFKKAILEPYEYILETKGKQIRSKLIDAFNKWIKVPHEQAEKIKEIIAKLHNASLMIDDIEDNSTLRRGRPCTHCIYGIPMTINSANYIYFDALRDIHQFNCAKANEVFMNELLTLHIGQGLDIYWRDFSKCPTEEQYIEMVKSKTGGLFRLSVGIMQALTNNTTDFTPLVNALAVLFQILDDYLNLQSTKYHLHKDFCEDLTEGKFSFPIIHCINNSNDTRLLNILKKRTTEISLKKFAVQCMVETKSFEHTIKYIRKIQQECLDHIKRLGGNDYLVAIIDTLVKQIEDPEIEFDKL